MRCFFGITDLLTLINRILLFLMSMIVLLGSLWADYNQNYKPGVTNKCINATKHFVCSKGSFWVNINTGLFLLKVVLSACCPSHSGQKGLVRQHKASLVINFYFLNYACGINPVIMLFALVSTLCPNHDLRYS